MNSSNYYPAYTGPTSSLSNALRSVGEKDVSFEHRRKIASANGITNYLSMPTQDAELFGRFRTGKLNKA